MTARTDWSLAVADTVRYFDLRPWQPRRVLDTRREPLAARVQRLHAAWQASRLADPERAKKLNRDLLLAAYHQARIVELPSDDVIGRLYAFGLTLFHDNEIVTPFPEIDLSRSLSAMEVQHALDRLHDLETRITLAERITSVFAEGLSALYAGLFDNLPPAAFETSLAPFTVPLYFLLDPADLTSRLLVTFLDELAPKTPDANANLAFLNTRRRLWENVLTASNLTEEQAASARHRIIGPRDYELSPPEMIETYLGGTPLADLVEMPLPFAFPTETRFEHMHVVGGAGHGKTQMLQHLITTDLAQPDPPSLIIIDSHGDMLASLERLDVFHPDHGRLTDRLILIDPEDVEHPPALNMFDMSAKRLQSYSAVQREQVEAATIELYDYIFRALAADLTSKQGVAFAFVARLLLTMPNATIHTLRDLMEDQSPSIDKSPFQAAIAGLDHTARAFFEGHFFTKGFADTKRQIARRIYDFIRNPTFERMFSSPTNKLDMFEAMNAGSIVLVNTSKSLLKSAASALLGRTMIALTLRAAFERVAIPPDQRRPAFLIIDEAADYFDANVDALLTQVRKYKLGLVFAHQYLDQLDSGLRASFAANTAIKLAGGVSDKDARSLAPDMRCRPELITSQRKQHDRSAFAAYLRNVTPTALSLTVPFGTVDRLPKMSEAAQLKLRERNRSRYTVDLTQRQTTVPEDIGRSQSDRTSDTDDDWSSGRLDG